MSRISSFGAWWRAPFGRVLTGWAALVLAPVAAAGILALSIGAVTPAGADGPFATGLQPPPYKYYSQYARKSGLYLNLGGIAYVRVPTIRLRVGAVKFREVQMVNSFGVGHFVSGVGHFRPGPSQYGRQQRILIPIQTPYYYKPYGHGGPFYGAPSGYVAGYYGMPGYSQPGYSQFGELPRTQLGYGTYGFNTGSALQRLPSVPQQPSYVGSFNAPNRIVAVARPPRPDFQPRIMHFNGATVKSGNLPNVHKPVGKTFIRIE